MDILELPSRLLILLFFAVVSLYQCKWTFCDRLIIMKKYLFIVLLVGVWSCEDDREPEDCAGVEGGNNICGCTDSLAINYNNLATYNDESCEYDTTPPNITITFIAEGSISEMVSISCVATDNEAIERVELWINGVATLITDNTEPYSLDWNTTTYEDGSYVITIRSYDSSGNVTDSAPITLTIDNSNSYPTVSELNAIDYENNSFIISWSQNSDEDFESYTLYEGSLMDMSDRTEIFYTNDVNITSYVANNIPVNEYRQYQLKTTDIWGLISYSSVATASSDTTLSILDIVSNANGYDGQIITIDGIVTVPAGLLRNNFTEVYIQDFSSKGFVL